MDARILDLIATVIECCEPPPEPAPGHPPTQTVRVLATLRRFLREGTPWRSLRASEEEASGSTLRRAVERWARTGLLRKVHALLVAMLRGNPTLILDSCSVRAKRGGDLTGPNPTDRGKKGTKYHVAVNGDGIPVACVATAANVNDTVLFERLFLAAFAVTTRVRTVFADRGYDGTAARLGVRGPTEYFRFRSLTEGGCVAWMLRLVKTGVEDEGPCTDVMEFDRPDDLVDIANLGLTLAEAKRLLAGVQREIVAAQAREHAVRRPECPHCDGVCRVKDYRDHAVATLFGEVAVRLPRFRCAACGGIEAGVGWPPHCRSTPELDRLQRISAPS